MSAQTIKATVKSSVRTKTVITIAIYSILAIFSAVMAVYDIATERVFFGLLFCLAAVIFAVLLLIKGNSVFGTYIKLDAGNLEMKSWEGDFLPYDLNGGFFSDLKPTKTKITSIGAEDITLILIGTKEFVKRNATDAGKKLIKALYPYEHSAKKSKKNIISAIDLFYVETIDEDSSFMCVDSYEEKDVVKLIKKLQQINPSIRVRVNSRDYKKHIVKTDTVEK